MISGKAMLESADGMMAVTAGHGVVGKTTSFLQQ